MLTIDRIPDGATDALAQALARAVRDRSLPDGLGDRIEPGQLTATAPHPAFVLRLDQLQVRFAPAADAALGALRFLLEVQHEVVAQAEVRPAAAGAPRFAGVAVGPLAKTTARVVELADALLAGLGDFTLAALDIPGMPARLLWLRSAAGADNDKWIPVLKCPPTVDQDRLYNRAELEELLVAEAKNTAAILREHPLTED